MNLEQTHPRVSATVGGPVAFAAGRLQVSAADFVVAAGPCAVESPAMIDNCGRFLRSLGLRVLRGGLLKFRTSPYSFSGHGAAAREWLATAAHAHGLQTVVEVMDAGELPALLPLVDIVQIGSRNMFNLGLLQATAECGKPVLLKRGFMARLEEFLFAAERMLQWNARALVLCERGVRGFDAQTRNILDLGAVALLKQYTGLPVWVDPSHSSGRADLVPALCRASIGAGADGLLIEIHPEPGRALSDGRQALDFAAFQSLLQALPSWLAAAGKRLV